MNTLIPTSAVRIALATGQGAGISLEILNGSVLAASLSSVIIATGAAAAIALAGYGIYRYYSK